LVAIGIGSMIATASGGKAPVQTAQRRPLSFGGVDDRLRGPERVFRTSSSCGAAIDRNAATMIVRHLRSGQRDGEHAVLERRGRLVAVDPRGRPMRRSKRP
jgi:hypothetical protein